MKKFKITLKSGKKAFTMMLKSSRRNRFHGESRREQKLIELLNGMSASLEKKLEEKNREGFD